MCILQPGKGDMTEKDAAMTMLNNTSSHSVAPVAFRNGAIAGVVLIDGGSRQARFSGESVRSHTDSTNVRT